MLPAWFRKRGYSHFDMPVGQGFAARAMTPAFVARHPFSPLISFVKATKRYRPASQAVEWKRRTIMYAAHRDACILSYYASVLAELLEAAYARDAISENVIAYRSLGKANYHFSAEALSFARANMPCMILAFDVTKFFDTLDHQLLKIRLKNILEVGELPPDWFVVFRYVTKFRHVSLPTLVANHEFAERLKAKGRRPIATLAELKAERVEIVANAERRGIPQGTPISSVLANLYLRAFDEEIAALAKELGGFYRRYSDDILFVCREDFACIAETRIQEALAGEMLEVSAAKTERTLFDPTSSKCAQYLGFDLHPSGASIRPGSMSRQWRKMRRAVRRIKATGEAAMAAGTATKVYTKSLRKRFASLPVRNFSSYARRSAEALGSPKVLRQTRRLERKFEALLNEASASPPGTLP